MRNVCEELGRYSIPCCNGGCAVMVTLLLHARQNTFLGSIKLKMEENAKEEPSAALLLDYKDFNKLEKKMVGGIEVLLTRYVF